jgi:hypothetical protein
VLASSITRRVIDHMAHQPTPNTSNASFMKLQVRDRIQAVIYAYETGLNQPAP